VQNSILQTLAVKFLDRPLQPRELMTARKGIYVVLIIVLFTVAFLWRRWTVEAQADTLAVREDSQGEVELGGAIARQGLIGLRGLTTCILWSSAIDAQKKNQWNELDLLVRWMTRLQPHFIVPWLFQSWNLSYNVSVECDRVHDQFFYITRGIKLLAEGERQNRDHSDMRFSIGFYTQHKISLSDNRNTLRSMFQLACMPPSERDPARFRIINVDGTTGFNWLEFEKFCRANPQLARRLREGIRRETKQEQKRQFICKEPEDVVDFLADNWKLPGLYEEGQVTPAGQSWQPRPDRKLPLADRFPVLPPPPKTPARPLDPPQHLFEPAYGFKELDQDASLGDDTDPFAVSRSWYSYSQECLPDPDDVLPGFSKEITDPRHQRQPKWTTLLFRNYPALTHAQVANRMQEEGWFDETPWEIPGWFGQRGNSFSDNSRAQLALPAALSTQKVWEETYRMWQKYGLSNHLLFASDADESNSRRLAARYYALKNMVEGARPPTPDADPNLPQKERDRQARIAYVRYLNSLEDGPGKERELYLAARVLWEQHYYRTLSNFSHHYHRAQVESEPETVLARRRFHEAEMLRLQGSLDQALRTFNLPEAIPAWRDKVMSVKNLAVHREFRDDDFMQEYAVDIELSYLDMLSEQHSTQLKASFDLAKAFRLGGLAALQGGAPLSLGVSALVPAYPFPPPIRFEKGPFDIQIPDDKALPAAVAGTFGMGFCPQGQAPLQAAAAVCVERRRPLLLPGIVRRVRERRNLPVLPMDIPGSKTTPEPRRP